ncbi:hypothetical protein ACF07D_08695 [Leucobacter sp. NPDC015123]
MTDGAGVKEIHLQVDLVDSHDIEAADPGFDRQHLKSSAGKRLG